MSSAVRPMGIAYVVGAGPGDPGLITLRGVECLRQAHLVLYDFLVNPEILSHAPAGAERICLGRHGQGRLFTQQDIQERMIAACRQGQTVVRLKGGDPAVFAHLGEEITALEEAGVPYEVVPGITAALAVGSYAGIPLTHREHASVLALITGQTGPHHPMKGQTVESEPGQSAQRREISHATAPMDYRALGSFPGTLVIYMGVTTARHWATELIAGGKSPTTPVAIIRRCSWSDQVTRTCQLNQLPDLLEKERIRPPVLVVVGDVVAQAPADSWFTRRPLFGKRILVTRPVGQAASLQRKLASLGAEVLVQPAIEITSPASWSPVDDALANLDRFDWLVFSSANGVQFLLDRLLKARPGDSKSPTGMQAGSVTSHPPRRDLRALGNVRLAAIGPGTAAALAEYRLIADLQPQEFRAEAMAAALLPYAKGGRFLLARASRGREVLAEMLRAAGAEVVQIVVYQSRDVMNPDPEIRAEMLAGRIDWVTVTSSAIARSLVSQFGAALQQARLVSISPITSESLRQLGYPPAAEAVEFTMDGVIEAIVGHHDRSGE